MIRRMLYTLHYIIDWLHICKIQWNIIKDEMRRLLNTCSSAPYKSIIAMAAHQLWTKIQYKNLSLRN